MAACARRILVVIPVTAPFGASIGDAFDGRRSVAFDSPVLIVEGFFMGALLADVSGAVSGGNSLASAASGDEGAEKSEVRSSLVVAVALASGGDVALPFPYSHARPLK